jgi:beta-lactamase class A
VIVRAKRDAGVTESRAELEHRTLANANAEIARIAAFSGGVVGVAAEYLETAVSLRLNDTVAFPMASTVKVPIALTLLDKVARGEASLADAVTAESIDMNPTGPVGEELRHPGITLSLANWLETMITRSDNTSTDVVLRFIGGPSAVAAFLDSIGIREMNPTRTVAQVLAALFYMTPEPGISMREALQRLTPDERTEIDARRQKLNTAYIEDPRDQSTPRAMLELLRMLWHAEGIPGSTRATLLPLMQRTSTGLRRIRGRLPKGVIVADKTGTASGTANDVGFVTLAGENGTIALAIFVKASPLGIPEREDIVADIARLIYDTFVLLAPGKAEWVR